MTYTALSELRNRPLRGEISVPGDKSISHRALMLSSLARGKSRIRGLAPGLDVASTARCLGQMGVEMEGQEKVVLVEGRGEGLPRVFSEPGDVLDCQNSGTTMRLLLGLVSGHSFLSILTGDESLRGRPMARIAQPLRQMGATVLGRHDGNMAPLAVRGGSLTGLTHTSQVASAQVKSALLLAGLWADGVTRVIQPAASRDHTERMLLSMGGRVQNHGPGEVSVERLERGLDPLDMEVPGDISSAAFLMAAAIMVPGSEITIKGVGLNPGRRGILEILRDAGADIRVTQEGLQGGEPVGDITVRDSSLKGFDIGSECIPSLIDEIPILSLLAALANGETRIRGAGELRVKESDRLAQVARGLASMGVEVEEHPEGLTICGRQSLETPGKPLSSGGDHRLALTWAVASLLMPGDISLEGAEAWNVSYPGFLQDLRLLVGMGS